MLIGAEENSLIIEMSIIFAMWLMSFAIFIGIRIKCKGRHNQTVRVASTIWAAFVTFMCWLFIFIWMGILFTGSP